MLDKSPPGASLSLYAEDSQGLAARIRQQETLREQHPAHRLVTVLGDYDVPSRRLGRSQDL